MKTYILICILLALCAVPSMAQSTSTAPNVPQPINHVNDMGFAYSLPSDWEVLDMAPAVPTIKQNNAEKASTQAEKKGVNCAQVALTARKGDPATVVVVMALPFDCFGQTMTEKDLPAFGMGAAQGLERQFNITNPLYSAYSLKGHHFWIERTKGTSKQNPELQYTVEAACTILKKGAACWLMLASDDAALRTIESGAVTLDGDASPELVPSSAFDKH